MVLAGLDFGFFFGVGVNWSVGFAEWIDEIRDEIFFGGSFLDDVLFVFHDDFAIGDFSDFAARDGEFWIGETFNKRAFDDDLLNAEIVVGDGKINNVTKLGTFFGFDFETNEAEI